MRPHREHAPLALRLDAIVVGPASHIGDGVVRAVRPIRGRIGGGIGNRDGQIVGPDEVTIDVAVEAIGFSATLSLRTTGNKQTVQISSKGDIRGVNITMVKS